MPSSSASILRNELSSLSAATIQAIKILQEISKRLEIALEKHELSGSDPLTTWPREPLSGLPKYEAMPSSGSLPRETVFTLDATGALRTI